jgi:hypothetical protein
MENHYEDPATHRCYWRDLRVRNRPTNLAHCDELGHGRLMQWDSAAERDAVYPNMFNASTGGGVVWIGLTYDGAKWKWDDGSVATAGQLAWDPGDPRPGDACAQWASGNRLQSVDCSLTRDGVCVRKPAGIPR